MAIERRDRLRQYVAEQRHRLHDGSTRTYEQIARDIGAARSTVYRWIQDDHPQVAEAICFSPVARRIFRQAREWFPEVV